MGEDQSKGGGAGGGAGLPEGYRLVYEGDPLPPFYAAEMLRLHVGKTVWVKDSGGRVRCGQIKDVPRVKENRSDETPPVVEFEDERPLYLRGIVCIAEYVPWSHERMGRK